MTTAWQWFRCDRYGHNCVPIQGATQEKYTPVEADAGHTLLVRVTHTDALGAYTT